MPFITQPRRESIEKSGFKEFDVIKPGDRCYVHYKRMVDRWRDTPGWTTAHEIYMDLIQAECPRVIFAPWGPREYGDWDDYTAMLLAWQVFFQLYVMPYELKKREENGDI